MKLQRCDFCYCHFEPVGEWRKPSGACNRCWLEIAAALSRPVAVPDWAAAYEIIKGIAEIENG